MTFWQEIDAQLDRIEAEKPDTFDGVKAILDPFHEGPNGGGIDWGADQSFFAGSGGDRSLQSALRTAGWLQTWAEESYFYMVQHAVTNETLTYIEGDVLRGDAR